jgi:hypothetical protein
MLPISKSYLSIVVVIYDDCSIMGGALEGMQSQQYLLHKNKQKEGKILWEG